LHRGLAEQRQHCAGNLVQKPGTSGTFSTSVVSSPTLASSWSQGSGTILLAAPRMAGTAQVATEPRDRLDRHLVPRLGHGSTGSQLPGCGVNGCGSGYAIDPSSLASFGTAATPYVYLKENH